jgi:hypothetical protein
MADGNENPSLKDKSKKQERKLDDALDDTFPASDPLSMTDPTKHVGGAEDKPKSDTRRPASP